MKKYYNEAKYNASFDRCIDVMSRLLQKYGNQVLEKIERETLQAAGCPEENTKVQPSSDKAA